MRKTTMLGSLVDLAKTTVMMFSARAADRAAVTKAHSKRVRHTTDDYTIYASGQWVCRNTARKDKQEMKRQFGWRKAKKILRAAGLRNNP